MMCSNGLNPREGIITVLSPVPAWISNVDWFKWLKSSGGDYYTPIGSRPDPPVLPFKWLKSSGGDYYISCFGVRISIVCSVQMA